MRKKLWSFDTVSVELEDRDAKVSAVHFVSGTIITVRLRLDKNQISGLASDFRQKLEYLATNEVLDLASFLELTWDEPE